MSRRNGRKNFAGVGNYNFCYFLYFFDERSGKADDCGTIKIGTIKHYPHEIIMSHRNGRNSRKGFAGGKGISVLSVLSVGQKYSFVEKPAAWYNKSPTEMAEMAEMAAPRGKKISFISFISAGQ